MSNNVEEIPVEWQFPERDWEGLSVMQVAFDAGLLSLELQPNPLEEDWVKITAYSDAGDRIEYVLGYGGSPMDTRRSTEKFTRLNLGRDLPMRYEICDFTSLGRDPSEVAIRLDGYFSRNFNQVGKPNPFNSLASFSCDKLEFSRGRLSHQTFAVFMGQTFMKGVDSPLLHLHRPTFFNDKLDAPAPSVITRTRFFDAPDQIWDLSLFADTGFTPLVQERPNHVVFLNQDGQETFDLQFGLEIGEDALLFAARLANLQMRMVKVLRVPIFLDHQQIYDAITRKPPYQRNEYGELDIPWQKLPSITGARLSYEPMTD